MTSTISETLQEISSTFQVETHFCKDCKHVLGHRRRSETAPDWKCNAKENISNQSFDLVTGSPVKEYKASSCYEARERDKFCGPKGVWFEVYEYPEHLYHPELKKSIDDLAAPDPSQEVIPADPDKIAALRARYSKGKMGKLSSQDLDNL